MMSTGSYHSAEGDVDEDGRPSSTSGMISPLSLGDPRHSRRYGVLWFSCVH